MREVSVNIVDFDSSIIQNQIANNLNEHRSQEGTYTDYIQKNACRVDACQSSHAISVCTYRL